MKQTQPPASAPAREALPMQVDVKIHALHASGPVLADASVNLNGCFAIRGVKVVDGSNGPFVSMPSYKGGTGIRTSASPVPRSSTSSSIRQCWTPTNRHWPRSPSASRSRADRSRRRPPLPK